MRSIMMLAATAALGPLLLLQPASASSAGGGPRTTNCAWPGKPHGAPCAPGHEQCCAGSPNASCPMRTYTTPTAVFHLGNTQGCGENDRAQPPSPRV